MVYLVILGGLLIAAVVIYSVFNKKWDVPQVEEVIAQDVLPQEEPVPVYESPVDLAPESTVTVKEADLAPTPLPKTETQPTVKKKPVAKKASTSKKEK
jgi:Flp pilus assembly protein CpaB